MANTKTKPANGAKKRKPQADKEKENQKPKHNAIESPAKKAKHEIKEEGAIASTADDGVKKFDASHINKDIFKIFAKLQETKKGEKHVDEMIALLTNETDDDKRLATCAYCLKRLIRCTGADDLQSVAISASHINRIVRQVPHIDPLQLLATLKRELHVSSQSKAKEETLAGVGQLVTIEAILQSHHFKQPSQQLIEQLYSLLISNLKGREYLVHLCVDIMTESFKQLSPKLFETHVYPMLQLELNKPLSALKLPSCDLLLAIHLQYPKLLSRKQLESSLWRNEPQYAQLFDLYLNSAVPSDNVCARLGSFLVAKANRQLYVVFVDHVVSQLPLRHNTAKGCVIRTLAYAMMHSEGGSELPKPLIEMLIQELATARQLKPSEKEKPSQLQLREICLEFEQALLLSFTHHLKQDASKVKLLLSLLNVELQLDSVTQTPRFTSQLLGQLGAEGVKQVLQFYSQKLISSSEEAYKMHGEHCLKQLQQLLFNPKLADPKEHLHFIQLAATFHVNESGVACEPKEASAFSRHSAARCEEILYSCLVGKLGKNVEQLSTLVDKLRSTLNALNELLEQQSESKVRAKLTPELKQAWLKIKQLLKAKQSGKQSTLSLAFDALILCLGLSIYTPNSSTPVELLNDLFLCKENALKATKKKDKEEINWQDVLTDLLLQLLVQKGHFWRELVNAVGGALMPQLNRDNLGQLLVVLDMAKNPLADKEDDEDDDDEEDEEEKPDGEEEESSDDDDDDEEDNDDEDEEEGGEGDDDEGATNLELIRENVRKALLAEHNNDDGGDEEMNDASSVDWNDVDEAEGERLNLALEQAFQAFKPKGGHSKKAQNKHQTKSERINATTLLHFRVRALDLVELYIQAKPQMDAFMDALITVFYVFEISSNSGDKSQQALVEASKKLLRKLLSQKISYADADKPDRQAIIAGIEHFIMPEQNPDQKQPTNVIKKKKGEVAEWRHKCVAYLVSQFDEPDVTSTPVWPMLQQCLNDWADSRNGPHSLANFDAILQSQWKGIPQLAVSLAQLLVGKIRKFRRQQVLELLVKHSRRIAQTLGSHPKERDVLNKTLTDYTAMGQKDENLRTKLLKNLQPKYI